MLAGDAVLDDREPLQHALPLLLGAAGGGAEESEALDAVGIARLEEHAWVRVGALRELAGSRATAEWEASLASMLDFARSRGWVDEEQDAVRGHVERRRPE